MLDRHPKVRTLRKFLVQNQLPLHQTIATNFVLTLILPTPLMTPLGRGLSLAVQWNTWALNSLCVRVLAAIAGL